MKPIRKKPLACGLGLTLLLTLGLFGCTSAVSGSTPTASPASTVPGGTATPAVAINSPQGWWHQNTVIYQIWVSAFQNGSTNASGNTGNLAGITAALKSNYFTDLGVNALWLSPVFAASSLTTSSTNKHGYDTTDYNDVAAIYGSNQDLSDLITAAHAQGIRVIFDFVPNHTSNQNPWFIDSASATTALHRDWYTWVPSVPGYPGPSNTSIWPGSDSNIWHYDNGSYYYGIFGSGMPDLNYNNPQVTAAMQAVVKGWMAFGFDGMRVDAARYLLEGTAPDTYADQPATHVWFDNLRANVLDAFPSNTAKFMMGEVWGYTGTSQTATDLTYLNDQGAPEFNVVLDFTWPNLLITAITSGGASAVSSLTSHMVQDCTSAQNAGGDLGEFQSNHDLAASRPYTAYNGNAPKIFLAAALDLLGQGIPIVYYGNEIAMPGSVSGPDTNMRQPFDWSTEQTLASTTDSLWQWHSALAHLRTGYGAWNTPSITSVTTDNSSFLAFEITSAITGKKAVIVANLSGGTATAHLTVTATTVSGLLGTTAKDTLQNSTLTVNDLPMDGVRVYALDDASAVSVLNHDPIPGPQSL